VLDMLSSIGSGRAYEKMSSTFKVEKQGYNRVVHESFACLLETVKREEYGAVHDTPFLTFELSTYNYFL